MTVSKAAEYHISSIEISVKHDQLIITLSLTAGPVSLFSTSTKTTGLNNRGSLTFPK